MDRSSVIFGCKIDQKTLKSAEKSKAAYIKKYGDDSNKQYHLSSTPIQTLEFIGAKNLVFSEQSERLPDNAVVVGNIRMGFGHYRISIAMASCAKALGYTPYWLDLASFDATGSKMIREQNDMYSLASKISQRSALFNKVVWEPLNSEGFKKLTYNAKDQKNSELLVPIFNDLPKDIPYIATHVWPAQGAIHAGLTHVVNAIPDNWPMALHLAEGAIHTVQTPFAYLGYKTMNGFIKGQVGNIPEEGLKMVGRYVDHELLVDLESDNQKRIERTLGEKPKRILLTVGGAGAGYDMFLSIVKHLIPYVKENKVAVFINFGDHKDVFEKMQQHIGLNTVKTYFNKYEELKEEVKDLREKDAQGVYAIYNQDIFEAVYSTNLLMRECDVLITKPSELAYYPIPKVFMRHIGGHEVYGAINSSELGDATMECGDEKSICNMLDKIISDKELYVHICKRINELKAQGYYNGGYECVRLATAKK